jgi:hypothetical protein
MYTNARAPSEFNALYSVEWLGGYEFGRRGVVLKLKCQGGPACSFRFKEMGMKPLPLRDDSFTTEQ